ncbi:MAG: glycine cleavage system aminomethyltransferase GcvT [Anaerolineae bacterium]|nr:glycine cleavage system aminomethyltransferase GcvT [Anaerolineae bacterium]
MARKTRLYDRHVALGGRMVDYAGWLLPVQYPHGPNAEHLQVRQAAGLFDIDHMGQLVVSGPEALPYLQSVMTADAAGIPVGAAGYSLLCYADGTVVDDTFIYRRPESYFVAVNAANNEKDTHWLKYHSLGWDVSVENISDGTYMLALQGPAAEAILNPLCDDDLSRLAYHRFVEARVLGVETLVGRTGYTGEDGFELFFPADHAGALWDALLEAGEPHGLWPIGLAARDSLRFEPCMPLYGQELSAQITPIEAGFGWAVAFDKGSFLGREALLKQRLEGPARRLVAFEMTERGVPRHDYPVLVDDEVCGWVTTGMYAPSLDQFLGLAYVASEHSALGDEIGIQIRNAVRAARIVKKPFYVPAYRRRRRA